MGRLQVLHECLTGLALSEDRFDRVKPEDVDWICERLLWHKVMPLAAALSSPATLKCPALDAAFKSFALANTLREHRYYKQVRHLFRLFSESSIEFIPFKGPFWSTRIFPEFSWRHIGDIDLLLDKENARAAASLLKEQGYVADVLGRSEEDDFTERGELAFSPGPSSRHLVPVELHWALLPAPRFLKTRFIEPADFTRNCTWDQWRSIRFPLPPVEVRFLYLALHATCQHQFMRFVQIMDLAYLIRKSPELDWNRLYELAMERGSTVPLRYALRFVNAFYELPPEAASITDRTIVSWKTRCCAGFLSPKAILTSTKKRGKLARRLFRAAMSWPDNQKGSAAP